MLTTRAINVCNKWMFYCDAIVLGILKKRIIAWTYVNTVIY